MQGFERVFEFVDDLEIDAPGAASTVAAFLARAVVDDAAAEAKPPRFRRRESMGDESAHQRREETCERLRDALAASGAGGSVEGVLADDEAPVGPTYWKSYHTVEELFALIDSALVRDAAQVTVQFDEALGYPTQLYIDEDLRIADEELGITASDVRSQL